MPNSAEKAKYDTCLTTNILLQPLEIIFVKNILKYEV